MTIGGNPFIDEGVRIHFGAPRILVSYLLLPCGLGLLLLAVWPRTSFEAVLHAAQLANTFAVVGVGFLLLVLYLSLRYGSEDYAPDSFLKIREYVTLTPAPIASVVAGKAWFALLHTLFLLLLGAPFLLASLAVAGVGFGQALAALAVIGSAGLEARMLGLLVRCVVQGGGLRRDLILLPGTATLQAVALMFVPAVSPLSALLDLCPRDSSAPLGRSVGPLSFTVFCLLAQLAAAVLLACCLTAVLRGIRGKARAVEQAGDAAGKGGRDG